MRDPAPDEGHYREWSRRLDLRYHSKDRVLTYLIADGTMEFSVTLPALYVPEHPQVLNVGRRSNQYDIWGGLETFPGRDVPTGTSDAGTARDAIRRSCERLERGTAVRTMHRNRPANTFPIFHCHRLQEFPPGSRGVRY